MKLCIPEKILDQHAIALGKTGAGKSSGLRHIVEHLLSQKKRVCVIDPKGDWWGLKTSADGKEAGFPVIMFGDFKEPKASDVPINPHSGKQIAELIASGNRPCVIGLRGWMPADQARFWVDFASGVFNANGGGLHLVIDEIQNFAPKERAGHGNENIALHWTKRLLAEGRGLGLTILCGSQRPQSVHNGVLTQCETLIGMRLIHPNDIAAVALWLGSCRDKAKREEILASIPDMPRGEAWVWSPEIGFGPQRVKFPMFETFDSFAPPQLQRAVSARGWNSTNLDEVRAKLATVIEEAKKNDPVELNRRIVQLERELAKKPAPVVAPAQRIEVPILDDKTVNLMRGGIGEVGMVRTQIVTLSEQVEKLWKSFNDVAGNVIKAKSPQPSAVRHIATAPVPVRAAAVREAQHGTSGGGLNLGKCPKALLTVLVQFHPKPCSKNRLALVSGYSINSSGFSNSLSELRVAGLIEGSSDLSPTESGIAEIGTHFTPLPEGEEAVRHWIGKVGKCPSVLLQTLFDNGGNLPRSELAEKSGYSITSSGFSNGLSELRVLGLVLTNSSNAWIHPDFIL